MISTDTSCNSDSHLRKAASDKLLERLSLPFWKTARSADDSHSTPSRQRVDPKSSLRFSNHRSRLLLEFTRGIVRVKGKLSFAQMIGKVEVISIAAKRLVDLAQAHSQKEKP